MGIDASEMSAEATEGRDAAVDALRRALGIADPDALAAFAQLTTPVTLAAGQPLFLEHDPGDSAYVVVRGRLRVSQTRDGQVVSLAELGRGELVGEAALVDGLARSASVHAIRDTELVRIDDAAYEQLLTIDGRAALDLARTALARARRGAVESASRPTLFALVPATAGVDLRGLAEELESLWGTGARVVSSADVDAELATPGVAQADVGHSDNGRLAGLLADLEARHTHLLLLVDDEPTAWTRRALRYADRIVLVADSKADPRAGAAEREVWNLMGGHHAPDVCLVLVHPADTRLPSGTAAWLAERSVQSHHHVRRGEPATVARLARHLEGSAVGLVLGGGGSKGFAHLGAVEVLEERGYPIDHIAGTSMGAVMAAGMALGLAPEERRQLIRTAFRRILDYTLPVTSVLAGRRITERMFDVFGDVDIADLWVPFFCVSTNLTRGTAQVHDRGPLVPALRASIAIPGVLPPVVLGGALHVDGGVVDNIPVTEMRRRNPTGQVLAIDVAPAGEHEARTDYGLALGGLRSLVARRRGSGPPRLLTILVRSTLVASTQARDRVLEDGLADLYLELELRGGGMLDFTSGDTLADEAASRTRPLLDPWDPGADPPGHVRADVTTSASAAPVGRRRGGGVLLLTLRDLQMRATRFASAIAGTAVVFTMLFLMTGLNEQFHREPHVAVDALGADTWVVRDGASGVFTSAATIPADLARQVPGSVPVVTARHAISDGDTPVDIVVIGYRPGGLAQPELTAGRLPDRPGEVVVDDAADVGLNEPVTIGSSSYTVVGHTSDTTLLAGMPFVFVPIKQAQDLVYKGRPLASALLLDDEPADLPEGFATLSAEDVAGDAARPLEGAVSSVNLVRFLLWFVAAMIIGTLVYLSALDRRRDVAVLKAVGGRTRQLGASIALQGVLVALVAVLVATGIQALLAPAFPLKVVVPGAAFWQLPVLAVLVALVSGAAGLRSALRTDPALAFSGPGQ